MKTRNKWAKRIGEVIANLECVMNDSDQLVAAFGQLDDMMLDALEPMEREVFEWIWGRDSYYAAITSDIAAKAFSIKQNHASMILSNLCAYGLLNRTKGQANSYVYNARNKQHSPPY